MSKRFFSSLCLTLTFLSAAGCDAFPFRAKPPASLGASRALGALRGTMEVPRFMQLLASSGDVAAYAGVVLRDQSGSPVATGTTEATGDFTLMATRAGFTIADGDAFTLEAVKRIDGALVALRTVVKQESGAWRSITGSTVKLNLSTSTLVKLKEAHGLSADDLLDQVDPATGAFQSAVGGIGVPDLEIMKASLTGALTNGYNPSGRVGKGGVYPITSQADLDAISAYTDADIIYFAAPDVTRLRLPNLKRCASLIIVGGTNVQSIELPVLETLNEFSASSSQALVSISWPRLATWGGMSCWGPFDALTEWQFPEGLTYDPGLSHLLTNGDLTLSEASRLSTLALPAHAMPPRVRIQNLPALTSLGSAVWSREAYDNLYIHDCPMLAHVDNLASAKTIDDFDLIDLPALQSVSLSSLTNVDLEFRNSGTADLTSLDLSSLTTTGPWLHFENLPYLQTVNLSGLATAQNLEFSDMPALQTLSLPALTSADTLALEALAAFTTVFAPNLTSLQHFNVYNGVPNLRVCDTAPWWTGSMHDGDSVTTISCP